MSEEFAKADATTQAQWVRNGEVSPLERVDAAARDLDGAIDPGTGVLVTADHGMVDSPEASRVDVDTVHELRDGLVLFGGEARFRQLYCQRGAVDDVVATWRSVLGDRAEVLTREDATALGWFGEVSSAVRPRIGDVVVACRGDAAVISSVDWAYEARLVGLHGSLTPEEMLIPVLVD